ncbi:MAG: DUF1513 domain-containing protein [Burkholderiaceae bacterium]
MPTWAGAAKSTTLFAAWQQQDEQHIGLLSAGDASWSVKRSLLVPTRAHGLWAEAGGSVLAVARRPGDWLLRWHPASGQAQWHWMEGDRRFNGHVIASRDGQTLWTTETDLETAQGRVGVRDARSLVKTTEWASHGADPHQLLTLPRALADCPEGSLVVANGGVPTLPETGRSKRALDRMDASLVALHPRSGALLGQWRLPDAFLSIRHLAWDPVSRTLGIALQAEHPDPVARQTAPVLAVWDGARLRMAEDQPPMAGYGGDICALPGGGFAVSCPRANRLALFTAQGRWQDGIEHTEACALANPGGRGPWWLASNRGAAGLMHGGGAIPPTTVLAQASVAGLADLQIDNHWIALPG